MPENPYDAAPYRIHIIPGDGEWAVALYNAEGEMQEIGEDGNLRVLLDEAVATMRLRIREDGQRLVIVLGDDAAELGYQAATSD